MKLPIHLEPVAIYWEDAFIDTDEAGPRADILAKIIPCDRWTLGLYLGKTATCHVIAMDYDERCSGPHYQTITQIPITMVKRIIKLCCSTSKSPTRSRKLSSLPVASSPPSLSSPPPAAITTGVGDVSSDPYKVEEEWHKYLCPNCQEPIDFAGRHINATAKTLACRQVTVILRG